MFLLLFCFAQVDQKDKFMIEESKLTNLKGKFCWSLHLKILDVIRGWVSVLCASFCFALLFGRWVVGILNINIQLMITFRGKTCISMYDIIDKMFLYIMRNDVV